VRQTVKIIVECWVHANTVCYVLQATSYVVIAGETVYNIQSRLGEGAYAKIYRIVPKDGESTSHQGKVIKVCPFSLPH